MSNHSLFLDLAARGVRMPIGTDLVLSEKPHHGAIKIDGPALGAVMAEAAERWRVPLAMPLMDLSLEKEWLGQAFGVASADIPTWHWSGDATNSLPQGSQTPRLEANNAAIRYIHDHTNLVPCGMSIGPFSLVTKLLADPITPVFLAGLGESEDPEVLQFETLLELATQTVLKLAEAQIDAGAEVLVVCEPAANTVYFSPKQLEEGADTFERYVLQTNRRVVDLLARRKVQLVFHDCGELTDGMVREFSNLGPAMLSLGSSRCLWHDSTLVAKNTVLYGNLPSKQFYSDSLMPVSRVIEEARQLEKNMRSTGHPFILGSECDVLDVPGSSASIRAKVSAMLMDA